MQFVFGVLGYKSPTKSRCQSGLRKRVANLQPVWWLPARQVLGTQLRHSRSETGCEDQVVPIVNLSVAWQRKGNVQKIFVEYQSRRAGLAAAVIAILISARPVFAEISISPDYILDALVVSSAGDKLDRIGGPSAIGGMNMLIVGQTIVGTVTDPANDYSMDLGFVPLMIRPPVSNLTSTWVGALPTGVARNWDFSSNWFPVGVPTNTKNIYYLVRIGPQPGQTPSITDLCRVRSISPTIKQLKLAAGFQLLADSFSAGLVTLSFDSDTHSENGALVLPASTNDGIIRVNAGANNHTFTLQSFNVAQSPSAELQAGPSSGSGISTLRLVDCTITGGILHSFDNNVVRLFDSTLINVQTIGLVIDSDQTSHLTGTINNSQDISVRGSSVEPSRLAPTVDNATLTGTGTITLTDQSGSFLGDPVGTLTNSAGHTIAGQGQIVGPIVNNGTIRADDSGGELQVNANVNGTGSLVADGATLDIPGAQPNTVIGSLLDILEGGTANINGQANLHVGAIHGRCHPTLRGCTPPVLTVTAGPGSGTGSPGVDVDGNIELGVKSMGMVAVNVSATARVFLGGNFVNDLTAPSASMWQWDGPLTFNGAPPQTFEMAGVDYGPRNAAGFMSNFSMNTLHIVGGSTVDFVDAFDNQTGASCEVLYVHSIQFDPGATIRINGCKVYYDTINIDPTDPHIVRLLGGALIRTTAGDVDGNSALDLNDLSALVNVLLGGSCSTACFEAADTNGDGRVDARDIQSFVRLLVS